MKAVQTSIPALLVMVCLAVGGPGWAEWSVTGVEVRPWVDLRFEGGSGTSEDVHVMATEVDVRLSVNRDGEQVVALALGPNLKTDMTGDGRRMHFGNYYAVFNFGVDKPKLKAGRFVVPFGTLAEYDTHPLVLQTPYARTLGMRLDSGVEVESTRGGVNRRLSVTGGDGRGRLPDSYAAVLRLARDFEQGDDFYRLGVSAVYGRQMPVFPITARPLPGHDDGHGAESVRADMARPGGAVHPPSAPPDQLTRADKTRLALDVDWLRGIDNIRAELVFGLDDREFVHGQWVSWNHPFSYATDLTLQADHWRGGNGSAYGLGVALHHRLDELSGVRVAYEPRRGRPDNMPAQFLGLVSVQWYRSFDLGF